MKNAIQFKSTYVEGVCAVCGVPVGCSQLVELWVNR